MEMRKERKSKDLLFDNGGGGTAQGAAEGLLEEGAGAAAKESLSVADGRVFRGHARGVFFGRHECPGVEK